MKTHTSLITAVSGYSAHVKEQRRSWIVLTLFIGLFLIGIFSNCSDSSAPEKKSVASAPVDPVVIDDPETPADPIEPTPEPEGGPPVLTVFESNNLYFFDGSDLNLWQQGGAIKRLRSRVYSFNDRVYYLNINGLTDDTFYLGYIPEIAVQENQNVWTARHVTPVEAADAGYLPRNYVEYRKNGALYGSWQELTPSALAVVGSDVFCQSSVGAWTHVNGSIPAVNHVNAEGLTITNYNASGKTAKINGVAVTWATNYLNNAKDWQTLAGVWYSENGYKFDGSLTENGSTMTVWRAQPYPTGYTDSPTMLAVSDGYWIECNSGYLVRYAPDTDTVTLPARLYNGDGVKASGAARKISLFPVISNGVLYFKDGADYYAHNLNTGLTVHFAAGVNRVYRY